MGDVTDYARARVGKSITSKYRLERLIGCGWMAAVYEAVHRNGHRVAIKMLHPHLSIDSDLRTLLHEGGHAVHALASRGEPLAAYREAPIEFCEVASMSMELLGAADVDTFYSAADANRSHRQLLEGIVLILPWIATVDAFQHWLYANPDHSRDERRAAWTGLLRRFGGIVDWSGHEEARAHS